MVLGVVLIGVGVLVITNLFSYIDAKSKSEAVASLHNINNAMELFKKKDWYGVGFKTYPTHPSHLYEFVVGRKSGRPHLIDLELAEALGKGVLENNIIEGDEALRVQYKGIVFRYRASSIRNDIPSEPVKDFSISGESD